MIVVVVVTFLVWYPFPINIFFPMAGLTLALAVHQQKAIPLEDRDKILFLMAGVVLLTVLVNGTTTKLLLHVLGLDRVSPAEMEMFVRVTNLIETELQDIVRELRMDEYLGDASWPVVWR